MPIELKIPIEPTDRNVTRRIEFILQGHVVDHIDDGRDDDGSVARNQIEQRLEPPVGHFDVRVEKHQCIAGRRCSACQTRTNETLALVLSNHSDDAQLSNVEFQRSFQMF